MSYSLETFDFDQSDLFPLPPSYLVWLEDPLRDHLRGQEARLIQHPMDATRQIAVNCKGQVRHLPSLSKARRYIRDRVIGRNELNRLAWAAYVWDGKTNAWKMLDAQGRGERLTDSLVMGKAVRMPRGKASNRDLDKAIASIRAEIERIES